MTIGLFWAAVALVAYTYAGYPLLLWLWTRLGRLPLPQALDSAELPTVSVIIAAHDEEGFIAEKLANCAAIDYPADRIEFLIGSDGSQDATEALVRAQAGPNVRLLAFSDWRGKAPVVNDLVAAATGDILVFTDANTLIEPPAIRRLVAHFGNPRLGGVAGNLVLQRTNPATGIADESLYWRYESLIKAWEGQLGLLAAAPAALHAQRRALVRPLPTQRIIPDDMLLAGGVLLQGYAVAYEATAIGYEGVGVDTHADLRRKVRVAETGFNVIPYLWPLLLPWRGRVAWMFWSHKLLRWLVPFFLLTIFVATLFLISQPFYLLALVAQVAFYLAAAAGYWLEGRRPLPWWLSFPYYFAGGNLAMLLGFVRSLTRPAIPTWGREAR